MQNERSDFTATSWTLVGLAGLPDAQQRDESLAILLRRYLPPLRWHLIVRKRIEPHHADDLLQDFVADKILTAGILEKAAREKGKFRTFLLVALDRFVSNQLRDERAAKRSPAAGFAGVPVEDAGEIVGSGGDMNHAFDVEWARAILDETIVRMRAACSDDHRKRMWGLFEDRVINPSLHGTQPTPYADIAARLCFASPTEAGNAVITARRMFVRLLHDVIAEYAHDEEEVQQEITDLHNILALK